MKIVKNIFEKISILSLDVVAGVVCGCLMFARQMHVSAGWPHYFVLGSSVWLIYTTDHLLDAFRKPNLVTLRHRFHFQHRMSLIVITMIVGLATIGIAFVFLSVKVLYFGVVTGCCTVAYLLIIHLFNKKYFFKEVWISILYTVGVWGSVAILASHMRQLDWVIVSLYFLLIFQDVLILACYEVEEDSQQQMFSSVHAQGIVRVYFWLKRISEAALASCVVGWMFFGETRFDSWVWATLTGIAGVLAAITYFPKVFRTSYLYRFLGDGILILPIVVVLLDYLYFRH